VRPFEWRLVGGAAVLYSRQQRSGSVMVLHMEHSDDLRFGGKKGKLADSEYPFKSTVTTVTKNNNEAMNTPKDKYNITIFPLFLGVLSAITLRLIVYGSTFTYLR
jgi:hypothetical protein